MLPLLFLICIAIAQNNTESPLGFRRYGHYCGLYHYDSYGRYGIDKLDEYCKIHDICTTRGLMDCHCNWQLLKNVESLGNPDEYRKSVIEYLQVAVRLCKPFTEKHIYYLGRRIDSGFNYLEIRHDGLYLVYVLLGDLMYFGRNANVTSEMFKYNAYYNKYSMENVREVPNGIQEFRSGDLFVNMDSNTYGEIWIERF